MGAVFGHYAEQWEKAGGQSFVAPHPLVSHWYDHGATTQDPTCVHRTFSPDNQALKNLGVHAVFGTLSEDPGGSEREEVITFVTEWKPDFVAVDAPRGCDLSVVSARLREMGYAVELDTVLTTIYGDRTARRRWVLAGSRVDSGKESWWKGSEARRECRGFSHLFLPTRRVPDSQWWTPVDNGARFQLDLNAGGERNPLLPRALGRIGRTLVYNPHNPCPAVRDGVLVLQKGGPGAAVRALLPEEEWRLNDGPEPEPGSQQKHRRDTRIARRAGPAGLPREIINQVVVATACVSPG